jgi:hypothetical protein
MSNINRQAVVILGMHRSGTSAVAGTAVRLGLAAPLTPLPAAEDNPGGFYESLPIVKTNHTFMRAADCAWNLCLTFEPDRIAETLPAPVRPLLVDMLRTEFGYSASFVMKDPRLCLTLPAWLPALRAVDADPRVLIVVRRPAEVVKSLERRNNLPEDETAPVWLHHMLEAERMTRGMPRAVILYSDLLRDWRNTMEGVGRSAGIQWTRPVTDEHPDVDAFIGKSARHHEATTASAFLGPLGVKDLVNAAWGMFHYLAENSASTIALDCLDYVRAQFATWRAQSFPAGFKIQLPPE